MGTQRFRAFPVKKKSGATIRVPFDPNEAWGDKERHHITGTIHGCSIRGALERDDDGYFLSFGPAWMRNVTFPEGDVDVVISPEGPQIDLLADDIRAAFAAAPETRPFFESLATFYRKGFIDPIEAAKRPATRAERIAEMIELLKAGKRQK